MDRMRIAWVPALLGTCLLAGCGDTPPASVDTPDARPAASGPAPAEPALAEPAPAEPAPVAFTLDGKGVAVQATGPDAPVLVDVRSAAHEGFDRMVFEFSGDGLPQWRVDWGTIPITQCGSGQVTPVSGTAWLQVRFSGAAAHTPEGKATSGPRQRRLRHPVLRDLARTCDFEGEVTWVAGLAGQHPFRIDTLAAPPRLVVDIVH
jgi:hypothetical protein